MDRFVDLDVIGALEGSDKSSSVRVSWDYLRHFETLLAEYRHPPINVLEIGVLQGASLRIWKWFFTQAEITGIDINPDCLRHAGERVTVEIGSQIDPDFLDSVCERAPPTIVVDDGSHVPEHMIFSFEHIFPRLAAGGLYIVEDITMAARNPAEQHQPHAKANPAEYFLELALCTLAAGRLPVQQKVPQAILDMVDRVSFIQGATFIHKRNPVRDLARGIATADQYMSAQAVSPPMLVNYAEWICTHDGPAERALSAVQAAIAGGQRQPRTRLLQAEAMERAGQGDEARTIIAGIDPQQMMQPRWLLRLANVQLRLGDGDGAFATYNFANTHATGMSHRVRRGFEQLLPAMNACRHTAA